MTANKLIIGITGLMAAGKGTAAKYFKDRYVASHYTFSTMLGDALDRFYIERSRDNFIKISEIMRGTFGEDTMAKTMSKDVEKDDNKIIVIEGVRRMADIEYLKEMEGFVLVEIFADINTRFDRLKKRAEKSDDATKTFAEFEADHERTTELSIIEVAKYANARVDNDGELPRLYQQLDDLINKYTNQ